MPPAAADSRAADWERDPKHVLFTLARYKFVARMFSGLPRVLEVGAGDGFASQLVAREVGALTLTDREPLAPGVERHDLLEAALPGFDAAYALDVYEHIEPECAALFLKHLSESSPVAIIGTPSLESQVYASERSKAGHVNCKTMRGLREDMRQWWGHVFTFSMNDEVLHTGFAPMSHYLFALGVK